jgi:hypothetical protein
MSSMQSMKNPSAADESLNAPTELVDQKNAGRDALVESPQILMEDDEFDDDDFDEEFDDDFEDEDDLQLDDSEDSGDDLNGDGDDMDEEYADDEVEIDSDDDE